MMFSDAISEVLVLVFVFVYRCGALTKSFVEYIQVARNILSPRAFVRFASLSVVFDPETRVTSNDRAAL